METPQLKITEVPITCFKSKYRVVLMYLDKLEFLGLYSTKQEAVKVALDYAASNSVIIR